ncbi:hypothetical protein [Bradyrhizobium sp. B120]|uniref:hypothetical protein n=1 Tax=Bradyrhizobium sp. B120 TaxID=3410088 RepID=UPI003B987F6A
MTRVFYLLSLVLAVAVATNASAQTPALLLFGGKDHKVFLGCFNCNRYDSGSICNKYGDVGSKYSADSIWNAYGNFGSKYSGDSPWNKYSSSAPIIVDRSGNSYGYFSANAYLSNRTQIDALARLADFVAEKDDLDKARDLFCGD